MTHDHWGVVSGAVALALGVFAVVQLVPVETSGPEQSVEIEPSISVPTTAVLTPDVPGVPASVDRILHQSGDARLAFDEELARLPPSVAAVLVEYGVTLRLASPQDTGQ